MPTSSGTETAPARPWRVRVAVAALLVPLLFGPDESGSMLGIDHGSMAQRLAVLAGLVVAVALLGAVRPPAPVWVVLGLFVVGFVVTEVTGHAGLGLADGWASQWDWSDLTGWWVGDWRALRALGGYVIPWLFFFVNLRGNTAVLLRAMAWLPVAALALTSLLDLLGVVDAFVVNGEQVFRLEGIAPAAYLGAIAMYGMVASLWLWLRGESAARRREGLLLLAASAVVLLLTASRGPIVFAAFVCLAVVFLPWKGVTLPRGTRLVGAVGAVVVAVPVVLIVVDRYVHRDAFSGALSARDSAWRWYIWEWVTRAIQGWGIGSSSELPSRSSWLDVTPISAPHNVYIQVLVDFGLPLGMALVVALFVVYQQVAGRLTGLERAIGLSAALATAVYAFFDNQLTAYQPACLSVLLFAALLAGERGKKVLVSG